MKKFELEVVQDTDPESPRTWDNLGTMVCFHKRYELGDKTDYRTEDYDSWEELKEGIIKNEGEVVILPLYLYDHSGITISTSPFGCNFDSVRIGFIFVSNYKIKKEGIDETKVIEYLESEVKTYDQYLTGEVYRYSIYEIETCSLGHEHKNFVEGCGGYFGEEECENEGKSVLQHLEKEVV
jgi:hypothetical protein